MSAADDAAPDLVPAVSEAPVSELDRELDSELEADRPLEPESGPGGEGAAQSGEPPSVESLLDDLVRVTAERDGHLNDLQRVGADFANFRKRVDERHSTEVAQAASRLVEKLLPVLDGCEAAVSQGAADVEPILASLLETLSREGLERVNEPGEAFDPNRHEAVQSEEGAGNADLVVAEVFRTGYTWNGRVVRPAMVKVRS